MTERPQVNIRLDRRLLLEIDELAEAERIDRSEMARRLLDSGMSAYRSEMALREYRRGTVTAWKAAELAGVSLYEMLDRIHAEGIPYELDPDVLARIDEGIRDRTAVREHRPNYGSGERSDASSGIAELREQFRPENVNTLFVGESSPAGGTHFYLANSNLFRATREAFAHSFGDEAVPDGPRFLHWFRERGCWLVDVADRPVNRLPEVERRTAVAAGATGLAALISEAAPDRIVVVKASIAPIVRDAAKRAEFDGEIVELPFPVRQWREVYVSKLARAIAKGESTAASAQTPRAARSAADSAQHRMTLDEAIDEVLLDHGNAPMSPRQIADEIAVRGSFLRPSDGQPPPASQISARASNKTYRDRYERTADGIRLRR